MTTCSCQICESARTGVWPEQPSGLYPNGGTPPPCPRGPSDAAEDEAYRLRAEQLGCIPQINARSCWRTWVAGPNWTGLTGWNKFREGHVERYHPGWVAAYAREQEHLRSKGTSE